MLVLPLHIHVVDLLGDGDNLLGDVGDGVDLIVDGVDLLGDGDNLLSIVGGSSNWTVAQKCPGAMKIQKYHLLTDKLSYGLTWAGARDTCVSKKSPVLPKFSLFVSVQLLVGGWVSG